MSTLHKPILPRWTIAALLVACGLGAYLLLPDDPQLIANLLRDGKTKEARRQLERVPPATRQAARTRYDLLELQVARRELSPSDEVAAQAFWQQAVKTWRESGFADAVFAELSPVIGQLRDPATAWARVSPNLDRAPARQRAQLVENFVRSALAANQPATAAAVFAAGHPAGGRTSAAALELARLWQLAGQPAAALAALGDGPDPALQPRRLELLRALNRNRDVLALLRARLDADRAAAPDAAAIEELVNVALQAGQPADALPYLRSHVERHPADLAALRRLRDLLVSAGHAPAAVGAAMQAVTLGGKAAEDLRLLGRILEWSGEPAAAFDAWLELALQGDLAAVDRLIALNPGLYRDTDLLPALEKVVPVSGRPEYALRLARLEVLLGRYDAALAHFDRVLAEQGETPELLVEVARIRVALNRFAEAAALLRRAVRLRPADPAIRRDLAAALVFQGRNDEALAMYVQLAEEAPTEDTIDALTRLAESLGRYDELARGIRRRIAADPKPDARDYQMLAYAYEVSGQPAARRAALTEGLQRLPASDDLRLQLASALTDEKKYVEAQALLAAHRRLREEPLAAALYLELMRLNHDTAAERRFLATPLTGALALDETVRERCALAYEALRDYAAAERLWRELLVATPDDPNRVADLSRVLLLRGRTKEAAALLEPLLHQPSPPLLRLAAEVASAAGNPGAAEKYQLAYLAAVRSAPAADWSTLGDIRLSRGDRSGARSAYAEALRRLQARFAQGEATP